MAQRIFKAYYDSKICHISQDRIAFLNDFRDDLAAWINWVRGISIPNKDDEDFPEVSVVHLKYVITDVVPDYLKVLLKSPYDDDETADVDIQYVEAIVHFLLEQVQVYVSRMVEEPFSVPPSTDSSSSPSLPSTTSSPSSSSSSSSSSPSTSSSLSVPPVLTSSSSSTAAFIPFWQQIPIENILHILTSILQPKVVFYGSIDISVWNHDDLDMSSVYPPLISRRRAALLDVIMAFKSEDDNRFVNLIEPLLKGEVGGKRCAHVAIGVVHFMEPVLMSLNAEYSSSMVGSLVNLALPAILTFSDDEIKHLPKDALSDVAGRLGALVQVCHSSDEQTLFAAIEDFNLKRAIKMLKCPYLDKRLSGLQEIRRMLEVAAAQKPEWVDRPLTMIQNLAANLHGENLIEILFGDNMHVQLLQRVPDVLKLMSHYHLTEQHLDMIWEASRGKHETVVAQIYNIVSTMPSYLPTDHTNYMFEKIQRAAKEACDEEMVRLIRIFSASAAQRHENYWGVDLLWDLFSNPEMAVSLAVRTTAFSCLQDTLRSPLYNSLREKFVAKCVENLRNQYNVPHSLRLMTTVFQTYGTRKEIDALNAATPLMPLLMSDFSAFLEGKRENNPEDPSSSLPRLECWADRLQFFLYLIEHSSLCLTFDNISTLWNLCVKPNSSSQKFLSPEEAKWEADKCHEFFGWLGDALNKTNACGVGALDLPTLDRILNELVSGLSFRDLSVSGCTLVERLFKKINVCKSYLTEITTLTVTHPNLLGMDYMWEIAFSATESVVSQRAISLINTVCHAFGPGINVSEKYEECVEKCMTRLKACSAVLLADTSPKRSLSTIHVPHNSEVAYAELQIERCFILLNLFLDTFEGVVNPSHLSTVNPFTASHRTHIEVDEKGEPTDADAEAAAPVNVKVILVASQTSLSIKPCVTVGELKDQVAAHLRTSQEQLKVICAGRHLEHSGRTLRAEKVTDGSTVHVTFLAKSSKSLFFAKRSEPPVVPVHPSQILSRPDYFNQLFDMLDLLGDKQYLADTCWNLLMKLPTNPDLLARLRALSPESVDWSNLLDSEHPYRLHYSLQVIASSMKDLNMQQNPPVVIHTQGKSQEEGKDASCPDSQEWAKRFVDLGGLGHLISILLSAKFESQSLACLSLLIQLLLEFVRASGAGPRGSDSEEHKKRRRANSIVGSETSIVKATPKKLKRILVQDEAEGPEEEGPQPPQVEPETGGMDDLDVKLRESDTESENSPRKFRKLEVERPTSPVPLGEQASSMDEGDSKEEKDANESIRLRMNTDVATTFSLPVLNKLFQFVQAASAMDEDPEEAAKAKKGVDVVSAVVSSTMELLWTILCFPQLGDLCRAFFDQVVLLERWVEDVLLRSSRGKIRFVAGDRLHKICKHWYPQDQYLHNTLFSFMTQFLVREADRFANDWKFSSSNFMRLMMHLYDDLSREITHTHEEGVQKHDQTTELLACVLNLLMRYPVTESYEKGMPDQTLVGLMNFACTLIKAGTHCPREFDSPCCDIVGRLVEQTRIIPYMHKHFLFDVPIVKSPNDLQAFSEPIRCKSNVSRSHAFSLLEALARTSLNNRLQLLALNMENHVFNSERSFSYAPSAMRQTGRYVGLANLGATCYMNSLMQQLYMVPEFRQGIFSVPESKENLDEDMLYQLQCIFGNLQESKKRFYDPSGFCDAYKDGDGATMHKGVQMDVNEFFNVLFDKLEASLKTHGQEKLLDDIFGGKISNQLICKDCPHRSERTENFYILSVEIKNKRSIKESLELYVEGEMLEGNNKYMCQECKKKVDTLKRACIKELPANLIIHLKRFEFDLENMRKVKINDYCEFPMVLDMAPYTAEYLESNLKFGSEENPAPSPTTKVSHLYQLTGVLVHAGTCNSGHYYSFIKERQVRPGETPKWFQFNDTKIETMEVSDLKEHCFGGGEISTQFDATLRKQVQQYLQKPYSAYMLFYQRIAPGETSIWEEKTTEPPPGLLDALQAAQKVPQSIFNQCWQENTVFARDKLIFDDDYLRFCSDLCFMGKAAQAPAELAKPCAQLACMLSLHTIVRKAKVENPKWDQDVVDLLKNSPEAACWLIEQLCENSEWIVDLLLKCGFVKTRKAFIKIVHEAVSIVVAHSADMEDSEIAAKVSALPLRLLNTLLSIVDQAFKNWIRAGTYWELLDELTPNAIPLCTMDDKDMLLLTVQFYLGKDCEVPHPKFQRSTDKSRDKAKKTMGALFALFAKLIEYRVDSQQPLNEDEAKSLIEKTEFVAAVIEDGLENDVHNAILIVKNLVEVSGSPRPFCDEVFKTIKTMIATKTGEMLRDTLKVLEALLSAVIDSRAMRYLNEHVMQLRSHSDSWNEDTRICLQTLAQWGKSSAATRKFIASKVTYFLTWLLNNATRLSFKDDIAQILVSIMTDDVVEDDKEDDPNTLLRTSIVDIIPKILQGKNLKHLNGLLVPALQVLSALLKRVPSQRAPMLEGPLQMLMELFKELVHNAGDPHKMVIMDVVLDTVQNDQTLLQQFANDKCSRLLLEEVVHSDAGFIKFNEMHLPRYCKVVWLVAQHNDDFANDFAHSNLFSWSVAHIALHPHKCFPACFEAFDKLTQNFAERVPAARGAILKGVFNCELQLTNYNALSILRHLLRSPMEALIFIQQAPGLTFLFWWLTEESREFTPWEVQHTIFAFWMTVIKVRPESIQPLFCKQESKDRGATLLAMCSHDYPDNWTESVQCDGESMHPVDLMTQIRAWTLQVMPDVFISITSTLLEFAIEDHSQACVLPHIRTFVDLAADIPTTPGRALVFLAFAVIQRLNVLLESADPSLDALLDKTALLITRVPLGEGCLIKDAYLLDLFKSLVAAVMNGRLSWMRFSFVHGLLQIAAINQMPELAAALDLLEQALERAEPSSPPTQEIIWLTQAVTILCRHSNLFHDRLAKLLLLFHSDVGIAAELGELRKMVTPA